MARKTNKKNASIKKKKTRKTPKKTSTKNRSRKSPTKKPTTKNSINGPGRSKEGITKIKVVGVGGAGGNIISRMRQKNRIKGVEYIAVNTDAQDLGFTSAHKRVHIGKALTRGLGAGMNPEIGRQAAEETRSEIGEILEGADIVFVTAGFGGGTGTGGAPLVAEVAKEKGILTIGIITKPFSFEGARRMSIAQEGIGKMQDSVDALVVVPNDRVFAVISKDTPIVKAFTYIDDVLNHGVKAIAELINSPGTINVDFADIKTILKNAGLSLIGVGVASGQDRSAKVIEAAVNSPLLEASIEGAKGALFSISGGSDLKMSEVHDIAKSLVSNFDTNARVIFGTYHDRSLKGKKLKLTVIATGFNGILNGGISGTPHLFEAVELKHQDEPMPTPKEDKKNGNGKKEEKKIAENSSEPWDIPAFLRKKKK